MGRALGAELSHCPSPLTVYFHVEFGKLQLKFSYSLNHGKSNLSLVSPCTLVTVQQSNSKLLVVQDR